MTTSESVEGVYPAKKAWLGIAAALGIFTGVALMVVGIRSESGWTTISGVVLAVFWATLIVAAQRNRTVVDQQGVRLWRLVRWESVAWEEITELSTSRSSRWYPSVVMLRPTHGRTLATDVPGALRPAVERLVAERRTAGGVGTVWNSRD